MISTLLQNGTCTNASTGAAARSKWTVMEHRPLRTELTRNSYKYASLLVFLLLARLQKKSINSPDEVRNFGKGKFELTQIGDTPIGKISLEPGWSWEKDVKPLAKTQSCLASHTQFILSGRIRFKMNDGTEEEYGPGDLAYVPPGHKAWVVGNDPFTGIELGTMDLFHSI